VKSSLLGLVVECSDGFINCTVSNAYGVFLVAPAGMCKSSILPPKRNSHYNAQRINLNSHKQIWMNLKEGKNHAIIAIFLITSLQYTHIFPEIKYENIIQSQELSLATIVFTSPRCTLFIFISFVLSNIVIHNFGLNGSLHR
jgi:hypothetical protein